MPARKVPAKRVARAVAAKKAPRAVAAKKAAGKRAATRVRRTNAQLFLDALNELAGEDRQLVINKRLREHLGWPEDRYTRMKTRLVGEGKIIVGAGPGGSVAPSASADAEGLKVFVSYSHVDDALKSEVMKHLKPLERMTLISQWHDRQIQAGDRWDEQIGGHLEDADIIILLVSVDFINSKYCFDVELERALERHSEGTCRVVPVILRGCLWQHMPFSGLQALPKDAKAATSWPDLDEALASVAEGILALAKELLASR